MKDLLAAIIPVIIIGAYFFLGVKMFLHNLKRDSKYKILWALVIAFITFGPFIYFFVIFADEPRQS